MRRVGRILLRSVLGLLALLLLVVGGAYVFLQTPTGKAWLAANRMTDDAATAAARRA